jgi:integrase
MYGWLQKDGAYKGENPAAKLEKNPEHGREVYLTPAQVSALRDALEAYAGRIKGNDVAADCLTFIIATGCRSGEAKTAVWSQFDESLTVWSKPASTTKQKKVHRVPLGPAAQAVLLRRRGLRQKGQEAVFPGKYGADYIRQLRSAWATVSAAAGLKGVRIHDLRHSFASLAISAGVPLKVVGGLLGHSAVATTNRYAHLYDDDLRTAADKVSALIEGNGRRSDDQAR